MPRLPLSLSRREQISMPRTLKEWHHSIGYIHSSISFNILTLIKAVKRGHIKCVELLLSRGADLNITNNKGETPKELANKIKPHKLRPEMLATLEKVATGEIIGASWFSFFFFYSVILSSISTFRSYTDDRNS